MINKARLKKLENKITDNSMEFTTIENEYMSELVSRFTIEDLDLSIDFSECRKLIEAIELKYVRESEIKLYNSIRKKSSSQKSRDYKYDIESFVKADLIENTETAKRKALENFNKASKLLKDSESKILKLYSENKINDIYKIILTIARVKWDNESLTNHYTARAYTIKQEKGYYFTDFDF
jgi:hypothetical protein